MSEGQEQNRELLDALATPNSRRTMEVVQRTRRNVMEAARQMHTDRAESRKRLGIALLVLGVFLLLATPLIWSVSEAAFSESAITDVSILMLTVFVVLLSMAMGALLSQRRRRGIRG